LMSPARPRLAGGDNPDPKLLTYGPRCSVPRGNGPVVHLVRPQSDRLFNALAATAMLHAKTAVADR
jgi:hypothetical protein